MANKLLFISFLILLLSLSFSAAQITLSPPDSVYSLGDKLEINIKIVEQQAFDGIVSIALKCDSYETPFFVNSIIIGLNEQKSIDAEMKLAEEGECSVQAELKESNKTIDSASTKSFMISKKINITSLLSKKYLSPGDSIEITGTAEKANNEPFNGIGTVTFDDIQENINIKEKFSYKKTLDEKTKSGSHIITLSLSDENGNSGTAEYEIVVQNVPAAINIELNKDTFLPGEELTANVALYGQSDEEINETVAVTLYNPWGLDIQTKVIPGGYFNYTFSHDDAPGNWWIYAFGSGIKERKFFFLKEIESADFEMKNSTLTAKNTGNIDYQKPIEVIFASESGEETRVIEVDIPVNKEESFTLSAPNGEYNITIKSKDTEKSFSAALTGNAISVKSTGIKENIPRILAFSFILAIIFLSVMARRRINSGKISVNVRRE